jgi:hypothetical protein
MAGGEPWLECPANWHYSRGEATRIAPQEVAGSNPASSIEFHANYLKLPTARTSAKPQLRELTLAAGRVATRRAVERDSVTGDRMGRYVRGASTVRESCG